MATELPQDDVQRWTAKRRVALVLSIVKRETSVADAARKHGLTVAEVEDWLEKFLAGSESSVRSHPRNDEQLQYIHRSIVRRISRGLPSEFRATVQAVRLGLR